MKALKFKKLSLTLFTFLLSLSLTFAQHVEKKEYKKEFAINKASTLVLSNSFGDINLINWDKNTAMVNVIVNVESNNEKNAKEIINLIQINFSEEGDLKKAITKVEGKMNGFEGFNKGRISISIDYEVKVPSYINLNLENKFGNAFVEKIDGLAELNVKFGTLKVNELTRANKKPLNKINIAYSDDESKVEKVNWAIVNSRYSEFRIIDAKALVIDSKYSEISIDDANSLVITSGFDEYTIDDVTNISCESSYTEYEIGKVKEKIEIRTKFGSVDIDYISDNFSEIYLEGKHTDIELNIDPEAGYKVSASSKYGDLSFPSHAKLSKIRENTEVKVYGTVGSGKGKVVITSKYGSVEVD